MQGEVGPGGRFGSIHSWALPPPRIIGNAEIRKRAAPMGMSVTLSVSSGLFTGLSCNVPTRPKRSTFHAGIFLALARKETRAVSVVNGLTATEPAVWLPGVAAVDPPPAPPGRGARPRTRPVRSPPWEG